MRDIDPESEYGEFGLVVAFILVLIGAFAISYIVSTTPAAPQPVDESSTAIAVPRGTR